MPNYGTVQSGGVVTSLQPGESMLLWNAESPSAPVASIPFNRAPGPGPDADAGTTFTISFASAPTATIDIQAANQDVDAQYITIFTSTNKQVDSFTDGQRFAFYRAKLTSQSAGGALTVLAQR